MLRFKSVVLTAIIFLVGGSGAFAQVAYLPDPGTVVYDDFSNPIGLVASKHDDFYSYSSDLLDQLGYPGFNESVGTGVLSKDILVYTGATGQDNVGLPGGSFPDPLQVPAGSPDFFSGTWGETGTYTPIKVDNLLTYLHSFDPDVNIPVFNFDMNQTGSEPTVLLNGQVRIWDTQSQSIVDFWAFDNIENDQFDAASMVLAIGKIDLGVDQCLDKHGKVETCYSLDNNKGSGSLDFVAYAPDMDLSKYAGAGRYEFIADFNIGEPNGGFGALNNGFEELYMTGAFAPGNTVPEPLTVVLLGTGLLGMAGFRRRA